MAASTKLKVDGLSQYKNDMKAAQNSIKQLDAELKLAAADYQYTGDKEKYAQKQTELLSKEVEQQAKAVDAAKNALKEMQQQGVDPNSRAYQSMQMQVTQAQTKLVTLKSKLSTATSGFQQQKEKVDEAKGSVSDYSGALNSINQKVSFDAVITGIDSVTNAIAGSIKKIAEWGKALWNFEAGASVWADTVITEANRQGVSVEDYQRMQYAQQIVDTDFEDIVKGVDKVRKARNGNWLELSDTFSSWSYVNLSGKSGLDAFWEVVEAIQKLPNEEAKANAAMKVFGKSYRELGTLFDEGARERWEQAMAEAPVIGEDGVAQLGDANDALVKLQAEFDTMKKQLAAELAPAFETIAGALTEVVGSFREFIESEEGKEALKNFGDAIASIITNFANEDTMKNALETLTGLVTALGDGLKWIADNSGAVVAALEAIGGVLAGLKVAKGVLEFLKLKNGLQTLLGSSKGASAATGGAGSSAGTAAASGAAKLGFGDFLTGAAMAAVVQKTVEFSKQAIGYNRATAADAMWADTTTVTGWTQEQRQAYEDYFDAVRASHGVIESSEKSVKEAEDAVNALFADDNAFGGMSEQLVKIDKVIENLGLWENSEVEDLPDDIFQLMQETTSQAAQGVESEMAEFYSVGQAIGRQIVAGVASASVGRAQPRNLTSNLYVNTMNMNTGQSARNLVDMIGNQLGRQAYAYGGNGG